MTGFEKVMAQNWCEQFIENTLRRDPRRAEEGLAEFYGEDNVDAVIGEGFSWSMSLQGYGVWVHRCMDLHSQKLAR